MKKHSVIITVLMLIQAVAVSVFAQDKPVAGDMISGVVSSEDGPLMMVNITERDSAFRIVAHTITDIEGRFSFRLVRPGNRLHIDLVGYGSFDAVIDRHSYEIMMKTAPELPPVWISQDRITETGPMPIPPPVAGQKISGYISCKEGPLETANVVEIDENDKFIAWSSTDNKGYFSFTLVNPCHRIQVSYVGFETVTYPIDRTYFDIRLKERKDMPTVDVDADRKKVLY